MSSKKSFHDSAPSLFIQSGWDKSQLFGLNASRDARHFVLRGTGGCALMEPKDSVGMRNLELALSGRDRAGRQWRKRKRFSGFCLFGGTRMVMKHDPKIIVPGITEVFPAIQRYCPDAVTLGVIAKVGHMRYTEHGLVIHDEPDKPFVTIVHPTQTSSVILQPSADMQASWDDEYQECIRICDALRQSQWQGLLIAYNGGGVTEKEILSWAKLGKMDSFWRVLLIRGSGRKPDEYASDKEWLAEHPTVHVCENDLDDMRVKLAELGAIVDPEEA
ncbi:MAG: hypothetical protein KC777_05085 [Cyanobacteria bacterium HKST-UBA02]|nr:hypothetical protein [Cyanobacteria bacterium HKST-UBA02]